MRTTLKRGIGRAADGNGNGRAVLPPDVQTPFTRYQQPEKRRGALRTVGFIFFILVALIVAAVLGVAGGAYIYTDENAHAFAPRSVQTERARKSLDVPKAGAPADALVIGYDHRPGDGNSPSRSDTVMLLRADPNTNTISMLSFPRDLIVNGRCPDGRTYVGRINAAYAFCGPAGTLETVRSLTDLPIHYLITVNFQGFRDIVNKLHAETVKALQTPSTQEKLAKAGIEPLTLSPAEFDARIKQEIATSGALAKVAGIKPN